MDLKYLWKRKGLLAVLFALFTGALFLFPGISASQTPGGLEIKTISASSYSFGPNKYTSASNETVVTVNNLTDIKITPSHSGHIQVGKSVIMPHTISNNGNVADTVDLEIISSLGLTVETLSSDGETPLSDSDENGRTDTGLIPAGQSIDIMIKLTAPEAIEVGLIDKTTVTAISGMEPSKKSVVTDTCEVLKNKLWDPLELEANPEGQVPQGTEVTYRLTFGNSEDIPVTNVVIKDILDPHMIYMHETALKPRYVTSPVNKKAALVPDIPGASIDYDEEAGTVTWTIPSVPAGYVGEIRLKATVDPTTPSDTKISNLITIDSTQTATNTQLSNKVINTVVEQPLTVRKTADRQEAEIGDYVVYAVEVTNSSKVMTANQIAVKDFLPQGFRYIKGSSFLDGTTFSDPAINSTLVWGLGSIAPETTQTLTYRAIVSIDAPLGNGVNRAEVIGKSPADNTLYAEPSTATVKVKEGVLNSKAIILGRIFMDTNSDLMPAEDEKGLKGVRVYLEDGSYSLSDADGKYSIYGIAPGNHILKIDRTTLPKGYEPVPLNSSFGADGGSKIVEVPLGGPARGDFGIFTQEQFKRSDFYNKKNKVKKYRFVVPKKNGGMDTASGNKKIISDQKKKSRKMFTFGTKTNSGHLSLEKQILDMPVTSAILEPENGAILKKDWSNIVVRVADKIEHKLVLNGEVLPPDMVGKIIHEEKKNIRIFEYISVKLDAGPNKVVLKTADRHGMQKEEEIKIFAAGSPEKIVISPDKADIPADGKTVVLFTVNIKDKWNNPAKDEHIVTVISEMGAVLRKDLDPETPGHQLKVKNGRIRFKLRSKLATGEEKLKVVLGNGLEGDSALYFTPYLREWIVAGIGEMTLGNRAISGNIEKISESDDFERGIYHDEKLAFFAKGKILGKYLLTAAYDTDKEKGDELFQRVAPDRYYPVYGDASEIGYEAESQSKLYVKVEKERSSVMFGDYQTELSENEFSAYNRTFNGLRADISKGKLRVKTFASHTSQAFTSDEIAGNGTSGYYFLSKTPVIENSEKVTVEVRDRYHSERIISTTEKVQHTDYTINYSTGAILFKGPVASVDSNLNPVFILVTYESDDPGDKFYIYGVKASLAASNGSEAGITSIVEEKIVKNSTLNGVDGKLKLGDKTEIRMEVAQSDTEEKGKDDAWKLEISSEVSKKVTMDLHYRDVGRNFHNPSMTGSEAGSEKYGADVNYRASTNRDVEVKSYVHNNKIDDSKLTSNSIGVTQKINRSVVETGYRHVMEDHKAADSTDKISQIIYGGVSSNITAKLTASARREQVINQTEVKDYQTKTALGLNYLVTEKSKLFITHEFQEGKDNEVHTSVFGIENRVTDSTTLTSRYHQESGMSGHRGQAILGLNNRLRVKDYIMLNTRAERVEVVKGAGAADSTALAMSAEYLPGDEFKASGRYEIKLAEDDRTDLYTLAASLGLSKRVSLLGKLSYWDHIVPMGTDTLLDSLAGIAYRPLGDQSIYLLSTLRYKLDIRGSTLTDDTIRSLVSSSEASYKLNPGLTLLGKYAGKLNWENMDNLGYRSYTDMIMTGVSYDITKKWSTGVYTKLMNQYQSKMHSAGYIVKTDYNLIKNLFAGIGYNSSQMNDRDLSGGDYKAHGAFLEIKFKFDEETFKH